MTDKTIRYTVDDKGVTQGTNRIRQSYEDLNKNLTRMSEGQRKFGKDELADIQKKIALLKQQNDLYDAALRKRIQDKQLEIQLAEKDLALWKARQIELTKGLKGGARGEAINRIGLEETRRKTDLTEEKIDLLDRRRQYQESRDTNKKQISELENIKGSLDKGTTKTIRSNEGTLTNLFRGLSSGSVGGAASSLLGLAGVGGIAMVAGTLISSAKSYQDGLRQFSVSTQTPISVAQRIAFGARDVILGMSGTEVLNKMAQYQPSIGRSIGVKENLGLIGLQNSRGFSDQQIQQLLSVSRYSGRSTLGTAADFERYTKERGDKSLIKLPELIEAYLRSANEILNRTGRVDALGVQQSLMSVGKTYGVSGLQLDKTMSGLTQLSTLSENPVLLSIQQQAFRKLYPNKDPFEMVKMLQSPAENPKLMKEILSGVSKFGGGGLYTKLGVTGLLGGDAYTAERLLSKDLNVEARGKSVTSSTEKELENKYYESSANFIGSLEKMTVALGYIKDVLNVPMSQLSDDFLSVFAAGGKQEQNLTRAVEIGTDRALKKNPR